MWEWVATKVMDTPETGGEESHEHGSARCACRTARGCQLGNKIWWRCRCCGIDFCTRLEDASADTEHEGDAWAR